jgi:hypothetical protein
MYANLSFSTTVLIIFCWIIVDIDREIEDIFNSDDDEEVDQTHPNVSNGGDDRDDDDENEDEDEDDNNNGDDDGDQKDSDDSEDASEYDNNDGDSDDNDRRGRRNADSEEDEDDSEDDHSSSRSRRIIHEYEEDDTPDSPSAGSTKRKGPSRAKIEIPPDADPELWGLRRSGRARHVPVRYEVMPSACFGFYCY